MERAVWIVCHTTPEAPVECEQLLQNAKVSRDPASPHFFQSLHQGSNAEGEPASGIDVAVQSAPN